MATKSQTDDLRSRKSSPTSITLCDTTTATLPATETSKYLKDAYHQHLDLITAQHVHNSHQTKDERVDLSHKPPIYQNLETAHHASVDYANSDPWVSRHTHKHKSTRGYHSSPTFEQKRTTNSAHETTPREGRKRNQTTEQTLSGKNTSTSDDNFHGKDIFRDEYQHLSDDEEEMQYLNNSFDKKGGNYFTRDQSPMATRDDEMGLMGSRSTVPEDVRLRINSRERQRMHDLNSALDSLRQVMPYSSGPSVKKLSKMSTLLLARNYIVMLTRSLEEMKRLVQELSITTRPKPVTPSPLLHDSAYYASILANHVSTPAGLYLPPPLLHHSTAPHCVTSTGTLRCACVECQRKSLFSVSTMESKKASS